MKYDGIVGMQKIEEHVFLIVRRKDHWRWNLLWILQALQTANTKHTRQICNVMSNLHVNAVDCVLEYIDVRT